MLTNVLASLISNELEKEYYDKFSGKKLDCLIEECDNGISFGHTSNYLYVSVDKTIEKGKITAIEL